MSPGPGQVEPDQQGPAHVGPAQADPSGVAPALVGGLCCPAPSPIECVSLNFLCVLVPGAWWRGRSQELLCPMAVSVTRGGGAGHKRCGLRPSWSQGAGHANAISGTAARDAPPWRLQSGGLQSLGLQSGSLQSRGTRFAAAGALTGLGAYRLAPPDLELSEHTLDWWPTVVGPTVWRPTALEPTVWGPTIPRNQIWSWARIRLP